MKAKKIISLLLDFMELYGTYEVLHLINSRQKHERLKMGPKAMSWIEN